MYKYLALFNLKTRLKTKFYNLKFHPDVESINKLTYLDMFFKEVLRMHPVANG